MNETQHMTGRLSLLVGKEAGRRRSSAGQSPLMHIRGGRRANGERSPAPTGVPPTQAGAAGPLPRSAPNPISRLRGAALLECANDIGGDTSGSSNEHVRPDWRQRRGMIIRERPGDEAASGCPRYPQKRPARAAASGFAPYRHRSYGEACRRVQTARAA